MNITGIIAEYNPLHNGHIYHIEESRKITNCDGIICVMSGNYVQRGLPAIIDKWNRAEAALKNGVDLVIELPTVYSLSSAEFFAFGSVSLLNNLCFGSESGNVDIQKKIATILIEEPTEFKLKLKEYLDKGLSYPAARSKSLSNLFQDNSSISNILSCSNNILGIEYCKSLLRLNSTITPYTVHRKGSAYNSSIITENNFCSATAIRKHLKTKDNIDILKEKVPHYSFEIIKTINNKNSLTFEDSMLKFLKFKAFTSSNTLENLPDVSEGLHNKILKSIYDANTYQELVSNIKSKRYAETRINRILCQYFIGFDRYNIKTLRNLSCPYARVLGFNNTGREILKKLKVTSSIPLYTKLPKNLNETLTLDIQATNAYSLMNSSLAPYSDYLISPITLL
ncbi:nucleotidyltransferase [Clostridium ganghwense]|uniref:tRNA(Met) cytidine acetate ligase n=1 Tax=Clostridium ganghwense TaxID=312089 RepID=A0ABT4CTH2_9CLOT|nr:nucleotidyltransferase [Clostridium ganghwense]MCY6372375.1 nucleotidyltransferase [Clostridium ganghwense]